MTVNELSRPLRMCGFAHQYHFSRRFRAVYGAPPSELRAKLSRGAEPPLTRLVRRVRLMPPGADPGRDEQGFA